MQELIKEIEAAQIKEVTDFNVGDTIKVHAKIVEGNRERIQVFEGLVIKKQGGSNRATFTVRKQSSGIGVERTWPLYSPSIANIEVVRRGKVRRAKLNYIRNRVGKAAKTKEMVGARIENREITIKEDLAEEPVEEKTEVVEEPAKETAPVAEETKTETTPAEAKKEEEKKAE